MLKKRRRVSGKKLRLKVLADNRPKKEFRETNS